MKKIMFYINTLQRGGAERVMCNLATKFSEKGYTCILVTSFENTSEYCVSSDVRRINLADGRIETNFLDRNVTLIKKLRNVLKDENPDILVSFMAEPNFRAIIASIGFKNSVIISVRNDPNKEYAGILGKILAKTLFSKADGIVFQTEEAKRWFPKCIQKKSKIIFNQVDEKFYKVCYEGKRRDIVTTGRLASQKNHEMLIRAFAEVAEKVSDNLIIYGEGELRGALLKLIGDLKLQDRVFLPGNIENVPEMIKSAKLFVLSSDYEGMPNALMEAMALGLNCISTDCPCGGPRMLIEDGNNGKLVSVGDVSQLSATILEVLCNDADNELGIKARKTAELFKPQVIFEQWEEYVCLVEKNREEKGCLE